MIDQEQKGEFGVEIKLTEKRLNEKMEQAQAKTTNNEAEAQPIRTVTYVKPETEQDLDNAQPDAETAQPVEASTQDKDDGLQQPSLSTAAPSSRPMQFLPQNGHRCETPWQFWYYQRQTPFYTQQQQQTIEGIIRVGPQPNVEKAAPLEPESYRDQLKPLGKMPTLEHFFNYYVHMKKPTEMPREIDIHFFRNNLVPMWEVSIIF